MAATPNFYSIKTESGSSGGELARDPLRAYVEDFDFAMTPNWDGEGARALSRLVINLARMFLDRFGPADAQLDVAPGADGSLALTWGDGHSYMYLDVGPNDTVHLFYDVVDLPKWEGVSVASDGRIHAEMARAASHFGGQARVSTPFIQVPVHTNTAPALDFQFA